MGRKKRERILRPGKLGRNELRPYNGKTYMPS